MFNMILLNAEGGGGAKAKAVEGASKQRGKTRVQGSLNDSLTKKGTVRKKAPNMLNVNRKGLKNVFQRNADGLVKGTDNRAISKGTYREMVKRNKEAKSNNLNRGKK